MNTENIIAYIQLLFDLNACFVVKKYNENNNKAYKKVIKCLLFNDFYKGAYMISDDLKKFVYNSLFKKELLTVLDNEKDITQFIVAYNRFIGYIPFKKTYECHKFNYISVMGIKNNRFLFVSIKSEVIDKCKIYIVVNTELYDSVMGDYDPTDSYKELDILNKSLIRDKKLRPYKTKCLNLESLIDIFYSYKKSIRIDNETYSIKNEFDNESDSYMRYLVSDFFDYYSQTGSLEEFYEYLTDKGLKLNMSLSEWLNTKETRDDDDYYRSLVLYIQLISFIKSNKSLYTNSITFLEYKRFLGFIIELKEKKIKFDKKLIVFILDNKTHVLFKDKYKEFLDSL